jgi:pimeloyl-ACP methyl ester carboxylesterase
LILLDAGGLNLHLKPAPKTDRPPAIELFLGTPAVRNPILATTATNPLFTKMLISSMILDPADATEEKIDILQQPLVLQDATNTLGDWLQYVLTVQEVSLTTDPANYRTLTMPALIVWGDSDTIIPLREGEYLKSILPNAELVMMSGVNHIPHLEDIDTLTRVVLTFLAERKL